MESSTGVTGWSGFLWTGTGCSLRAPSTAVFRPIVGVANSKRKTVVNIWMIITLVVASMIDAADGLSRGPGIPLFENSRNHGVALAWIVVLAEIAFLFYGAANLVLESPFLAALFWALMGLGLSMTPLLEGERLCREAFHDSSKRA